MTKLVLVSFFYEHLGWGYLGLSMVFAGAFTFSSHGGIDREERKHRKVLFLFKAQQIEKSESGPSFWRVQIWNDRSQKPKKNYGRHPFLGTIIRTFAAPFFALLFSYLLWVVPYLQYLTIDFWRAVFFFFRYYSVPQLFVQTAIFGVPQLFVYFLVLDFTNSQVYM